MKTRSAREEIFCEIVLLCFSPNLFNDVVTIALTLLVQAVSFLKLADKVCKCLVIRLFVWLLRTHKPETWYILSAHLSSSDNRKESKIPNNAYLEKGRVIPNANYLDQRLIWKEVSWNLLHICPTRKFRLIWKLLTKTEEKERCWSESSQNARGGWDDGNHKCLFQIQLAQILLEEGRICQGDHNQRSKSTVLGWRPSMA